MKIIHFTKGTEEEIDCFCAIKDNSIIFEDKNFLLKINFIDTVDIDNFIALLKDKEEKMVLECYLKINDKVYTGERKIKRKDNLIVSLGGSRFEFDKECQEMMLRSLDVLRH